MRLTELPRCLDAVQERHRYIDHDDIRVMPGGCGEERPAVSDRANQIELSLENAAQTFDDDAMIVGEQKPRLAHVVLDGVRMTLT
jgi:hypothetical protein